MVCCTRYSWRRWSCSDNAVLIRLLRCKCPISPNISGAAFHLISLDFDELERRPFNLKEKQHKPCATLLCK